MLYIRYIRSSQLYCWKLTKLGSSEGRIDAYLVWIQLLPYKNQSSHIFTVIEPKNPNQRRAVANTLKITNPDFHIPIYPNKTRKYFKGSVLLAAKFIGIALLIGHKLLAIILLGLDFSTFC